MDVLVLIEYCLTSVIQVSYKKIETNQLMGSIQLGIHDSVGGLAKYPERFGEICIINQFNKLSKLLFKRQNFLEKENCPTICVMII